jgi:hypothetical protein
MKTIIINMETNRKPGRPPGTTIPPEEKRVMISMKVSPSTKKWLQEHGNQGRLIDRLVDAEREK